MPACDFYDRPHRLADERNQMNPAFGLGNQLKNTLFELTGLVQDLHGVTVHW